MSVFEMRLKRDRDGRIVEKTESVAGRPVVWKYAYDKAGRLFEAHLDNRLVCQCWYDRDGRRQRDCFPATVGASYRDFRYNLDNRLMSAGNNGFTHDKNGFRSIWSNGGTYHLYEYAPDYRLLKMEVENQNRVYTYRHDEQGRRAAKYFNGQLVEAYRWLDFIRLGAFHDGRMGFEFGYADNERLPSAMRRDDGAVFTLHYDQVGSLRVVADTSGNVIKEVLYDPFGGIIEDTNPDLRIPIGFAGGLHDRDLGFVRFGWRDYDTFTGRWTAPDPIGDKGGDPDWYGYCLDDPVNGNDPLGLWTNEYGEEIPKGRTIVEIFPDYLISPFMSHHTKNKIQKGLRSAKDEYADENDWEMRDELEKEAQSYTKTKAFFDSYTTSTDEEILEKRIGKARLRIGE